ncbi:DUF6377 domain-containing protein [Sphingobacterium tabacisoli]|uniref:DUF6377 domain-containing protein n=1 Tax=Sphingobacterium tabacisoli TaxID=2044855 RepID=UPI0036D3AD62
MHVSAQDESVLLNELDKELKISPTYIQEKERRIENIKLRFSEKNLSTLQVYTINKAIFEEFRTLQIDSAINYVEENAKLAKLLGLDYVNECRLLLSNLYTISGRYIESNELLDLMYHSNLAEWLKSGYYEAKKKLYSAYTAQHPSNPVYQKWSEEYRDSLLGTLDTSSNQYKTVLAEKLRLQGKTSIAKHILLSVIKNVKVNTHEYAIITSAIGNLYKDEANLDKQKHYFCLSAIADIKNAIRENTSLQSLAIALFETKDIDRSYRYSKQSMEDAIYCNAPLRTLEISRLYPIIDSAYQEKSEIQWRQLFTYLILISMLSVGLFFAVFYIIRQMNRIAKSKMELHHANSLLKELNETLQIANSEVQTVNEKLAESNRIKEEYIGNFLDLCSSYIIKLEDYRKNLHKKATNGKTDELLKLLKSSSIAEQELKQLYKNFDKVFVHLYPDFVDEFNKLLLKEEQFVLKPGEVLNTELRIFALIRLGIQDSSRIANFLRYSASTVYNYRTKVRNKAGVPRETFESMVMTIGNIV